METTKKRVRRDYAPLNVAISLICTTPGSLPTQVFNSENQQYEADRTLTPCVILPSVVAHAKDGSWINPYANSHLSEMKWYVNGKNIATLSDWGGKYEIDTTPGSTRGAITIKRNVAPGTVYSLKFEGVVADMRTGMNIPIVSEEINLSTSDKSKDGYAISIGESQIIQYNPFKDKLSLYEYKVAHGLIAASSSAKEAATDENAYLCDIPLTVYNGIKIMPDGYTVKLYSVSSSGAVTELTTASHEVEAITGNRITLDLRLIVKADFIVRVFVGGKQIGQEQFSVNRVFPKFNCRPTNGTSIGPNDTERYDVAMVDSDGNKVECPESILKIIWKTDTESKKGIVHNEGGDTLFQLVKTGVGNTYQDDWLDVYTEAEHKEAHRVATDENGNVFTDENGNTLIFN